MKKLPLLITAVIMIGASCSQLSPETGPYQGGSNTPLSPQGLGNNQAATNTNSSAVPTPPANGLTSHSIHLATSPDQQNWEIGEAVVESASVPDMILLEGELGDWSAGTLVSYFVDASTFTGPGTEQLGAIVSTDNGATWSEVSTISIEGAEEHTPVDPAIYQHPDGSLYLYYYDIGGAGASTDPETSSAFYSAVSTDGLNFTLSGPLYQQDTLATDPDVIYFGNSWHLFFAQPSQANAPIQHISSSRHIFSDTAEDLPVTGIPGAVVVDNELRVYGCGQGGITYSSSSDGETWSEPTIAFAGEPGTITCDPAPVQFADGSMAMMVKQAPMNQPAQNTDNSISVPVKNIQMD